MSTKTCVFRSPRHGVRCTYPATRDKWCGRHHPDTKHRPRKPTLRAQVEGLPRYALSLSGLVLRAENGDWVRRSDVLLLLPSPQGESNG